MNKRPYVLLLLAVALLPCARVEGVYANLGNDRVLLMNNDLRPQTSGRIENQGYYDTNSTIGVTYWTHEPHNDNTRVATRFLLHGTNHVLHAADGTPLWHLVDCRAGYVATGAATRNYIPWSTQYAQKSEPPVFREGTIRYYTNEVNACVIMRNTAGASVYSPSYEDGIGTIYFDIVNSYTMQTDSSVVLEIATNVTASASGEGFNLSTVGTDYDKVDWRRIPMTVLSIMDDVIESTTENVESLVLNATEGGTRHYFRVRSKLNYYGPVRFRIRRESYSDLLNGDTDSLIALDNIIASCPPMTIRLNRQGGDYDETLKGSSVLGCMGDFNRPFLANGASDAFARASFSYVTNFKGVTPSITVSSPQFHYRWRYLNQVVDDWATIPFEPSSCEFLNDNSATQLVTSTAIPLNRGVGDLEYYFTADLDAQYYSVRDYANDTAVGFGAGWTEKMSAITNRATYARTDNLPSMGTDYFTRIREGESNFEWVQLVGTLTITNRVAGSNEVVRLLMPDGTTPRMTLEGDHSWRYHYAVPTNAIGGKLSFKLVSKEYYTNETAATSAATPAAAMWHVRTNELYAAEGTIADIPYTMQLDTANRNDISVALDDSSSHLKIEYNDERNTLSFTHASYQSFNLWTDAADGFRGNSMDANGVSNSGVSADKKRYDAPFDGSWEICPEDSPLWHADFNSQTLNGWTARNASFVAASRDDASNLALALEGRGRGAVGLEQFSEQELPRGIGSVSFNARISQTIEFEDFATYSGGASISNYAISAKITMSRQKETSTVKPTDMSPVHPSVSFVGYYRDRQGCYEFRMTRTSETELTLALYKWMTSGSSTKPTLLTSKIYTSNLLVPTSDEEVTQRARTAAYLLVYTLSDGRVKLEGHLSSERTVGVFGVSSSDAGLSASSISYLDDDPGVLARGGSYGVGSADCRAGFGAIRIHDVVVAPTEDIAPAGDAKINWVGTFVGYDQLEYDWAYYPSRWEVDSWSYDPNGGISAVVPPNQEIEVWLSEAGGDSGWSYSGYSVAVNSFSTNRYTISPRMPGACRVILTTGEDGAADVTVDDVDITPWEGLERWGRTGSIYDYSGDWVYTKGWITGGAENARVCTFQPSRGKDGYPMGLRSPYIDEGMSLFSYSYENADSNCVMLVQIATNMAPSYGTAYVPILTDSLSASGNDQVWITVDRHVFKNMTESERKSGTMTTVIGLRQHRVYDPASGDYVYTNVCGAIRVIVDPYIVSRVVNATPNEVRDNLVDYGKITITKACCYNEPALSLRSWFGWNVHTEGWDGMGNAGPFANMMDQPTGLSIALNFSALWADNTSPDAQGIGLGETDFTEVQKYVYQNPFIQSAALTNGIGTVSFRARLFDTSKTSAVVTLYGSDDPCIDQPMTEDRFWKPLTNFVITTSTYQAFEWTYPRSVSPYQAIRLEAAGARWGRYPSPRAYYWEWDYLTDPIYGAPVQMPINRVFIDDMSVGESVAPVADVSMISASVGGKLVSVPVEWFAEVAGWSVEQIRAHLNDARDILEESGRAANGRLSLAECYVLGIDPKDPDQDFVITEFPLKADGSPDLANIKFEPSPEKWNIKNLAFKLKGTADLAGEWQDVQPGGGSTFRFFKVEVALP